MPDYTTTVADVIVPEIFNPHVMRRTEEKSRLIQSGAVIRSTELDNDLAGGGLIFNAPSFGDLDNVTENISSDEADDAFTGLDNNSKPHKIRMINESVVRLSRNQSWGSSDLTAALAGVDPMDAVANLVASYWERRLQAAFIATVKGVLADNAAAPTGTEHVADDLTHDISGTAYEATVSDFSASAFINTAVTMGDSMGSLSMMAVHSIVYARMQTNNLIEYVPDSRGEIMIPTFLGRTVIVDDSMPNVGGVFESWLFGDGAIQLGLGTPKVATEVARNPDAGNGGGAEVLYNRVEWAIHPTGHGFIAPASKGGPSNAATTGNLAHADSWQRAYSERKQIKIARLRTREF